MSRPYNKGPRGGHGGRGGFRGHGGGGRGGGGGGHPPAYIQSGGGRGGRDRGGRSFGGRGNRQFGDRHQGGGGGGGGGGGSNDQGAIKDVMHTMLNLLFEKHTEIFNPNTGALTLSNMHSTPELAAIVKSVDFNNVQFCKSLAQSIKDKFQDNVRVIDLSNNKIQKLAAFLFALKDLNIHHNVTAISVSSNDVNSFDFLKALQHYEQLGEVIFSGNPICNDPKYPKPITQKLKRLTLIDGSVITHSALTLLNPVRVQLQGNELNVILFVESQLFTLPEEKNVGALDTVYGHDACLSFLFDSFPVPSQVPASPQLKTMNLSPDQRIAMKEDILRWRHKLKNRNLERDPGSAMREIARNRQHTIKGMKDFAAADQHNMQINFLINPNANVVFLQDGMKTPICVITVHAKMKLSWVAPVVRSIYQEGDWPFIATFLDRTLVLTWNDQMSKWEVTNDMIFLRPDKIVVHEDGSATEALYFATADEHAEKFRRMFFANATLDVVRSIMQRVPSDQMALEAVNFLRNLPDDQSQKAAVDPAAALAALGFS